MANTVWFPDGTHEIVFNPIDTLHGYHYMLMDTMNELSEVLDKHRLNRYTITYTTICEGR